MRRLRRILLNALTILSMALFLASLAVFLQPRVSVADAAAVCKPFGASWGLSVSSMKYANFPDVVVIGVLRMSEPVRGGYSFRFARDEGNGFGTLGATLIGHLNQQGHVWRVDRLWLIGAGHFRGDPRSPITQSWAIVAPPGVFAAFFAVLPLLRLRKVMRRASWIRAGRCADCGYDLRATPGRCPECGRCVDA